MLGKNHNELKSLAKFAGRRNNLFNISDSIIPIIEVNFKYFNIRRIVFFSYRIMAVPVGLV